MFAFDDSPCWLGRWTAPEAARVIWAQSAVARTVRALPELHPLRLGDDKGTSGRVLAWCGAYGADGPANRDGLGVLTQLSPPPAVGANDSPDAPFWLGGPAVGGSTTTPGADLLTALVTSVTREVADAVADAVAPTAPAHANPTTRAYRRAEPGVHRWAGSLARLAGAWLPPVVLLPRAERELDDPSTAWSTESVDFAMRHTVHSDDTRLAADLLAPHVIALILDGVPDDAAMTISGDALHIWWGYDDDSRGDAGRVAAAVETAAEIAAALPTFVLADYPDHSQLVEDRLDERAAAAAAYRAARDARLAARRAGR